MSLVGNEDGYLEGQLLIAMPGLSDPRFSRSVVFMCAHNAEGAMGLIVNKMFESVTFADILKPLNIENAAADAPVHFGGPVETSRGFVLHSPDYTNDGTILVGKEVALTATVDILRAIAAGTGPAKHIMALGYAGWGPQQLDMEIRANGWLHTQADVDLVFGGDNDLKWDQAMSRIGVDPGMLSDAAGHA